MNSIKAITFDELVEYGKTHGANIVDGIPRSFTYECRRVTHENDNLYIIGNLQFHRGQLLVCETISPGSDILSVWVDASDPYIQAVGHLYADKQNLSAESFRATMNAPYGTTKRQLTPDDENIGSWLSAALDDPKVCDAMKSDIRTWMDSFNYPPNLPAQATQDEMRKVFVCSNPECGTVHAVDPCGHCPVCIRENGLGWSTIPRQYYDSRQDPLQDDSLLQSRRAFVESWRLESAGSNGHDLIANRNTVRRFIGIIDGLAAQPRATPSDEESTTAKNAKRYVEFREHACTASWEEKGRVGIEFSNKLDGIEHPTHEQFDNAFDAALNPAKKQDEPCDCDADKYNKLPHHADCAVLTAQPRAVPDAKAMAYRFMGWRLPEDFAPDAGISFKHMTDPAWTHDTWPVGTNLFTVDQAEQMFRYVLNVKDEDQVCGVCGEPNTYDPEGGVCKECQGVVEKHKSGKVENLQSGAIDLLKELRDLAGYIENGSGTTVKLFQDDATAEWFCTVGKKEYHASTFIGAIEAAVKGNDHD